LRSELDLESADSMVRVVREIRAELIVNAAAYTAVDRAETDVDTANRVNAEAVGILAEEAKRGGAVLVHYSTDYVFSGSKAGPYTETDEPDPINVYGRTKLIGEERIREVGPLHLIFRTSWVYGTRGRNFLVTVRRLAGERPELRIVNDQTGSPTWSRLIAEATAQVIAKGVVAQELDREWFADRTDLYHMTAAGAASWHEFARAILEQFGSPVKLTAIPSAAYPVPAARPANSLLDNGRLASTFGVRLPDWRVGLSLCMEDGGIRP
jgi:dTDP-4-dehydrorhamnose reductase